MIYYNKAFIINYTSITVYVTLEDCLIPRISIRKVRGSNSLELLEVRIPDFPVTCESVLMVLAMYFIMSHPEPPRTPELRTYTYRNFNHRIFFQPPQICTFDACDTLKYIYNHAVYIYLL